MTIQPDEVVTGQPDKITENARGSSVHLSGATSQWPEIALVGGFLKGYKC